MLAASAARAEDEQPPDPDPNEVIVSDAAPVEPPEPGPTDSDDPDASNDVLVAEGGCPPPPGGEPSFAVPWTSTSSTTSGPICLDGSIPRPAVECTASSDVIHCRNADGLWTIYLRCFDARTFNQVAGRWERIGVGPGYVARLRQSRPGAPLLVDDYRLRPEDNPGFLNAINGGLGTFGWHHARGTVNATPAGDDPTTTAIETGVGRNPATIEGRTCANALNGPVGVYARSVSPSVSQFPLKGAVARFTVDVFFREGSGAAYQTGFGPGGMAIARVRYRYTVVRSAVRSWISVTTYAKPSTAGTPFVKEPKFTAIARGGGYKRLATLGGADGTTFQTGVVNGEAECTGQANCSLDVTGHSAADHMNPLGGRKRVRWDYGTVVDRGVDATGGTPGCSASTPCLNVVMRSYATLANGDIARVSQASDWERAGFGLDRWAAESAARAKAYPRDTRGGGISTCGTGPASDVDGNGVIDDRDYAIKSQDASPDLDGRRRWEHGGWKAGDSHPADPDRNENPYQAAFTFFHGWEDERGPTDCEPLQRAFGPQAESFGTFAVYSLNDGWTLSP